MRKHIIFAAAAVACLCAGPAMAGDSGHKPKSDMNEIVCKSLPPPTGTRIGGRRICMTKAQWEQQQNQASDALSRQLQNGRMAPRPGGGGN